MTSIAPDPDFRDERFQSDVHDFYECYHRVQTHERALERASHYAQRVIGRPTLLQRFDALGELRDASDDDLAGMSQLGHALQTTDAIRRAGKDEDWIVLGLIHDLGKILLEQGEAPELVVGDTYPTGGPFGDSIRHRELLDANPDSREVAFQTTFGIYSQACGLDALTFSFGHDEYLWEVLQGRLPFAVAWTLRYHSFQSAADDYLRFFDDGDRALRESHMRPFAALDLYTKHSRQVSNSHLAEYRALLAHRFPDPIDW